MYIYVCITPKKGTTITVHFKLDCHRAYNIELSTTTSMGYSVPAINIPKKYRRLYAGALYNVIVTTCLLWHNGLAVRLTHVNTLQYRSHPVARRVVWEPGVRAACTRAQEKSRVWKKKKRREKPFRARRGAAGGPLVNVDSGNARAMVLSRQRLRCAAGRRASDSFAYDDFYFTVRDWSGAPILRRPGYELHFCAYLVTNWRKGAPSFSSSIKLSTCHERLYMWLSRYNKVSYGIQLLLVSRSN